jgi:hypothetical protein
MTRIARLPLLVGLIAATAFSTAARGQAPVHFDVFADTGIKLTGVLWSGSSFLYVENTTNAIFAGDANGGPLEPFAKLPKMTEETRCVVAPEGYGFPAGQIYCHVPDNRIFRISPDGKTVTLFASLPTKTTSDGMLDFDRVGRFGHRLVAATGRSGSAGAKGGAVYTIDKAGTVRHIGDYPGPGGADGLIVAPAGFGSAAGSALLTVDPGPKGGTVVAMDAKGRTRTIASLPTGPNPIVAVGRAGGSEAPKAGFYVADTNTHKVYFASAAQLASYVGGVVVGAELQPSFWAIRPHGGGFVTTKLETDLPAAKYNFESAYYAS